MDRFELVAPCHFGLEAVLKREIIDLGYDVIRVEDGRITFEVEAKSKADAKAKVNDLLGKESVREALEKYQNNVNLEMRVKADRDMER